MRLEVKLHHRDALLSVGSLLWQNHRIFFEYHPDFLQTDWDLSPFHLAKRDGLFEATTRVFDGLHGMFFDALPDGWGLLLMDRYFRKKGLEPRALTPLHRLAYMGDRCMGALSFEPAEVHAMEESENLNLSLMEQESLGVYRGNVREVLELIRINGGSPGGARPKAVVGLSKDNQMISGVANIPPKFEHYLVKFAAPEDGPEAGLIEEAYARMARAAGIDMPETRLLPLDDKRQVFAIKRFDRQGNHRIHIQTLSALIHADHHLPSTDYETFLKVTTLMTRDARQVRQAFRRMVFNVLAHNRDDHVKNFAFALEDPRDWKLSPAYDLTFSRGMSGEHMMTLVGEGLDPGRSQFETLAQRAEIPTKKAAVIIEEVQDALSAWPRVAKDLGISPKLIKQIGSYLP